MIFINSIAVAKLEIQVGENNSILRTKSVEVVDFGKKLKKLVTDMKTTMKKAGGLGLAAPQVGVNMRLIMMILDYKGSSERVVAMVNPQILEHSDETEVGEEGCLSLPGQYGKVERFVSVKVEFFDTDGVRQILELSGLDAREVQHEYDHLEGVLFTDRVEDGEKDNKEELKF